VNNWKEAQPYLTKYGLVNGVAAGNATMAKNDPGHFSLAGTEFGQVQLPSSDADAIAQAIIDGTQPPDMKGLYSKSAKVKAALAKQGYDLTSATLDWNATTKYWNNLNSTQQIRLRQATEFAYGSLDLLDKLNVTAEEAMARSNLTDWSKVNKELALRGIYGQEVKSAFTQLNNQVSDLVSELATVYSGGYSTTDDKLKLASAQLNTNWDYQTLKDNINLTRKNLQIRINSVNNAKVVTPSSQFSNEISITNKKTGEVDTYAGSPDDLVGTDWELTQ
jgi:hypothetical protein